MKRLLLLVFLAACASPEIPIDPKGKMEWLPGTDYQARYGVMVVEDTSRGVVCYIKYNPTDDSISCLKLESK